MEQKKKRRVDPMLCGVPNVNFSIFTEGDSREKQFKKERLERGFDESETWSLDFTIARFILPRLKEFTRIYKKIVQDSEDENGVSFYHKLDESVTAFEIIAEGEVMIGDERREIIEKGLKSFADIYMGLWW